MGADLVIYSATKYLD
ncbi:hypothetical protein, partial [Acinetobacter baumannii]